MLDLGLTSMYLIHTKLIVTYRASECFIFIFLTVDVQFLQHHLLTVSLAYSMLLVYV